MSTVDVAITFFRRNALTQFRAECTVTRETAPGAFNPTTGEIGAPTTETVYAGRCNAREVAWEGSDVGLAAAAQAGRSAAEVRLRRVELRFPHDTAVLADDVVTITKAQHDSDLVGEEFRITDVLLDAWQIVRRAIGERAD